MPPFALIVLAGYLYGHGPRLEELDRVPAREVVPGLSSRDAVLVRPRPRGAEPLPREPFVVIVPRGRGLSPTRR